MKKLILLICFYSVSNVVISQQQTFDLATFSPPKGWKKQNTEAAVQFTKEDAAKGTYCLITLYKAIPGKPDSKENFDLAWETLIKEMVTVSSAPEMQPAATENGWEAQSGYAPFESEGSKGIAILVTSSGFEKMVNIIILTNTDAFQNEMTAFLESVTFKKPTGTTNNTIKPTTNTDNNAPIIGTWIKSGGINPAYGDAVATGNAGYTKDQYTFNSNGTYNFLSKTFRYSNNKLILVKENGNYSINGTNLIITPTKSVIESWTKKDGTDKFGSLATTQNRKIEKITYQFTKHYFSGLQIWNLVLQASAPNERDGPFSRNNTFSNAWYYAPVSVNNTAIDYPGSISDVSPTNNTKQETATQTTPVKQENKTTVAKKDGFAFTTTNFDDGWTSTVQEDWVEVTKGNIKVLLHYPKQGTIFPADPDVLTNAAWNILVAPRYSNLKNYKTAYISTYDRPYLGMGYATENATGKNVFIVFFRQGQSGWLEFITPDKNSFIQQYKFDPETIKWDSESNLMNPLAQMVNYNKFAIAAGDFKGTWTSDFTGVQQLYSVYTGNYAGMNINQSNEEFAFGTGNSYSWKILVVNGMVGNMKYGQAKSAGKFTVLNNWQISFSNIEGKSKKYHAFFSCIKGARVLKMLDANAPGSGMYTVYGKK